MQMKESAPADPGLRANSVGLPGAVIMSAAIMGPAVSTFFNPQFSTPFSGPATPFVYLVALVGVLITASGVIAMASVTPSAGSFYTYVAQGLGPRTGFVTGGLLFVAYALLPPIEIALIGSYLQQTIKQYFGLNIPWVLISVIPWVVMTILALEGLRTSLRTSLILFGIEVAVVLLMALIVVLAGGNGGLSAHPLTPAASPHGIGGIVTGLVFGALSFVGFEGATTLGEEAREPRRTIPRAIALSTLAVGLLYVFCIWAEVLGLGDEKINALTGSSTPWNDLAGLYAPWMTPFIVVASVSSMFAVAVAANNGVVRVLYAMGREGLLPAFFAKIDPKHRVPSNAVWFQGGLSMLAVLIVGQVSGGLANPDGGANVYGYLGFVLTLAILIVYVLANAAAIAFFRRRGNANPLLHVILPGLGILMIIGLFVGQIIENTDPPYTWMPWLILAWFAALCAAAAWLSFARPSVIGKAGAVLDTGAGSATG